MKITALVENNSCKNGIKQKHGLSLYIETSKHKILFDLGPDKTLFENAESKGIDLSEVDTVIISHGHMDHGGALEEFLKINNSAEIYIQRKAFEPHYTKVLFMKFPVGLDEKLAANNRVILLDGDYTIDDELSLFTVTDHDRCYSRMNDVLLDCTGKDSFSHEQNLLINESKTCLVVGCGHAGIVNILEAVKDIKIDACLGGYHLSDPITKRTVSESLLDDISNCLSQYQSTQFYTCHCTGMKAFGYLSARMNNLKYLYCGDEIEL